jgi:hypothetical protein
MAARCDYLAKTNSSARGVRLNGLSNIAGGRFPNPGSMTWSMLFSRNMVGYTSSSRIARRRFAHRPVSTRPATSANVRAWVRTMARAGPIAVVRRFRYVCGPLGPGGIGMPTDAKARRRLGLGGLWPTDRSPRHTQFQGPHFPRLQYSFRFGFQPLSRKLKGWYPIRYSVPGFPRMMGRADVGQWPVCFQVQISKSGENRDSIRPVYAPILVTPIV